MTTTTTETSCAGRAGAGAAERHAGCRGQHHGPAGESPGSARDVAVVVVTGVY